MEETSRRKRAASKEDIANFVDSMAYFSAKQKEARTLLMQSASHVTENSPLDDWLPYAACRGKIDLFFRYTCTPRCNVVGCQRLSSVKACRAICAACPVLIQCRKWSVAKVPVSSRADYESDRAHLADSSGFDKTSIRSSSRQGQTRLA